MLSCVLTLGNPTNFSPQALLSMDFSRQEYWTGLPVPTPVDLPDLGIKPKFLASLILAGRFFTTASPGKPHESRDFTVLFSTVPHVYTIVSGI